MVTVASKHEATEEVASAVARRLDLQGFETTVAHPHEVSNLDGHDAVVLGSAI